MKSRVILILLILSAAVNVTVAGVAGWRYLGRSGAGGTTGTQEEGDLWSPGIGKKLNLAHLNLTPAEKEQFRKLSRELRAERMKLRQQIGEMREQVIQEVHSDNPDMEKINQLIDRISEMQKGFQKSIVKEVVEKRKTLAPQQKAILDKMIDNKFGKNRGLNKKGKGNGKGNCFQM
jgi:Spy/CpxP family protein refolding chaperone